MMAQSRELDPGPVPVIPDFEVRVQPNRELVVLEVSGEICLSTAPLLIGHLGELVESGFAEIVLDLREVVFMDSTGVRLLVDTEARASAEGFRFAIVTNGGQPGRVLELVGMSDRPPRRRPEDLPAR
jgi:anti-sigma B factor antagonist